jgi:hypothetical protein
MSLIHLGALQAKRRTERRSASIFSASTLGRRGDYPLSKKCPADRTASQNIRQPTPRIDKHSTPTISHGNAACSRGRCRWGCSQGDSRGYGDATLTWSASISTSTLPHEHDQKDNSNMAISKRRSLIV